MTTRQAGSLCGCDGYRVASVATHPNGEVSSRPLEALQKLLLGHLAFFPEQADAGETWSSHARQMQGIVF